MNPPVLCWLLQRVGRCRPRGGNVTMVQKEQTGSSTPQAHNEKTGSTKGNERVLENSDGVTVHEHLHHITCVMDQKNTTGAKTKTIPRLIVKIVGSKQVKQFIQEPDEETQQTSEEAAAEAAGDSSEKPAAKQEASHSRQENRENSALWDVIKQVPDRSCVTAPSGDRSRSYIHPRTPHVTERREAAAQETTNFVSEQRGKSELASAVRRELSDWLLSSLRSAEVQVAALDLSSRGTVNRTDVTHLFLKNDVPLKLPTFSLLLQMFSEENDPEQIHHRNLLHFIETSAFPDERN